MANETFTVTQTTALLATADADADGVIDPGETVVTTVTITNNSTNTNATGVTFTETLAGMTLVNQTGNDVNVSPVAFDDAYTAVGNTLLEVGNATSQTGPQSNVAGSVLNNDIEFFGDTFAIGAVGASAASGSDVTITTTLGGTVTMVTSGANAGSFTYISQAGDTGIDTFTYTIRDKGLDGVAGNADDLVSTSTVSITLTNKVWYIDNTAGPGGDGTSTNPFNGLDDVSGASGPDGVGDFIYVNTGSGDYTGGITLLNNQTLHGEGATFTVAGFNLAAAGADPTIANSAGSGVTVASGNTLTGFTVGNTTGFDITNTLTASAGALTISDVTLNGSGGLIQLESGASGASIQLNSATTSAAGTDGINLNNVDNSTFTVNGVTTINDASSDGIAITNSQNSAFTFTGKTTILNDGGANGDGVDLQNNNTVDSTFNFNGGVDITVNGTDAFGFRATSSGTVNILNPNADNQITSNNGTAIFINPTAFNANLTTVTAGNGGTGDGIHLDGVSGTGVTIGTASVSGSGGDGIQISNSSANITFGSGSSVSGTTGTGFLVGDGVGAANSGGTGAITYNGTVTTTGNARAVDIQDRALTASNITLSGTVSHASGNATSIFLDDNAAGTITFAGANSVLNSGTSSAVQLTDNTGATINFSGGGLNIDSTGGTGFSATGGGTVNVTGSNNSVTSTTGIALNIVNTTIGSSGLTFHDISSNGAVSGIVLNNTGSSGGLTVTGDGNTSLGGNNSGGTIQFTTDHAISLTNTLNPSFTNINAHDIANSGIFGRLVTNFTLANSTISNVNTDHTGSDANVAFNFNSGTATDKNVSGAISITNNNLNNSYQAGVDIQNYAGTISNLTITGNHLTSSTSAASSLGSAINVVASRKDGSANAADAAQITAGSISGNTIANFPAGAGIQVIGGTTAAGPTVNIGSLANPIIIDSNVITGAGPGSAGLGTNGIALTVGHQSNGYFTVGEAGLGNTITNVRGNGIAASLFGTGTAKYVIAYNTIDANNTAGSPGINTGADMATSNTNTPLLYLDIHNNSVQHTTGAGILSTIRSVDGTGIFKIEDNSVTNLTAGGLQYGIRVDAGNGGESSGASVTLKIEGNTAVGHGNGTITNPGIGIRQNHTGVVSTFKIEGLSPSPANDAQMEAYVSSQNPGSAAGTFGTGGTASISSGATFTAGNATIPILAAPGGVEAAEWQLVGIGDFNGDGSADLLSLRADGLLRLDTLNDSGVVTNSDIVGQLKSGWHVAGIADLNIDGTSDILLRNEDGAYQANLIQNNAVTGAVDLEMVNGTLQVDAAPAPNAVPSNPLPQDNVGAPGAGDQSSNPALVPTPKIAGSVDHDLNLSELAAFVDAAITRWEAAGLSAEQVAVLRGLTFTVGGMSGQYLGSFQPGLITLDADAGERGWYLDATPLDDSEFGNAFGTTRLQTDPTAQPAGHFDLLTTVMHEMGHALGLEDNYAADARDGLMYGWQFAGERRLPSAGEADGAVAGSIITEEFAGQVIQVLPADATGGAFTLPFATPPGKSVTIQWHATIDAQTDQKIVNPVNVGNVTSTNFPSANSANITTLLDTLILGGTVWNDNGAGVGGIAGNGIKDGSELGISGVQLTLFRDFNDNNVFDSGIDTVVMNGVSPYTAVTNGTGDYQFTDLAPGDYIVRVDAENFDNTGGGDTLTSLVPTQVSPITSPEPQDPDAGDPDTDNDDNGARVVGQPAYSNAITLAYNDEPTGPVSGNDTNTTLDFGFLANQPPVAANIGPFSGAEDATSPLRIEITLSATDPDAGDAVESFKIVTVPAGGSLFLASTGGAAISAAQVITATGSGPYTALVYFQPNADFSGTPSFTYTANDGVQDSAAATASISVTATPDVSVTANDVGGTETDATINIPLSLSTLVGDVDASETLTNVVVTFTGAPAGLTAATGVLVDNGGGSYTLTLTAAQVAGASITVPADYSGLINGSAVANTNEGASTADPFTVTVTATPEPVTANDVVGAETDAAVNIPLALSVAVDDDGSETLTNVVVTFTGAPAGLTAPTGALVDNGGGSYTLTLTPAEVAGASITVPADYAGLINGSAVANSNEGVSAADPFTVTVTASGDVSVTANDVVGAETDAAVTVNLSLSTLIDDVDGSETLTNVVVTFTGAPAGLTAATGVLIDNGGGSYTLTLTAAQVAGASITVPADYSGLINGSAVANTNEGASAADPFTVTVTATAEPITANDVAGAETDATVNIPLSLSVHADADGSETLIDVVVTFTGAPAGLTAPTGVLVDNGGGSYTLTLTPAQVAGASITVPADYAGLINGSAVANSNESASAADPFTVTVTATGDVSVTANDVGGTETNAALPVALSLSTLVDDVDGSETVTNVVVTLTGAPAGMTAPSGVLVDNGGGSYTLTLTAAQVAGASITVPADYAGSFTGSAVATTNEGVSAADGFTVNVTATGDASVTANDVSADETNAALTVALSLSALVTDADGSETLTDVVVTFTGAPAGMTAPTGTLIDNGGGSYTLTLTPAQVAGASITLPANYVGSFTGSAVANSNEGSSALDGFTVTVNPINDAPTFAGLDNTPGFTENGAAVVLDSNATMSDVELDMLNAGAGNYNGAVLTLARNGGANANDVFGRSGTLSFSGSNVLVGATTVGTFTNAGGQLQITFNANANSSLTDQVLQQITYATVSEDPPFAVQINYSLSDGNTGSQGSGLIPGIGTGSITVNITAVNDPPVLSDVTATASYRPNGQPVTIDPALTVSDFDNTTLFDASVRISAGSFVGAGDMLAVSAGGLAGTGITAVYNPGTLTLTLSGIDSLAHYEQVLEHVTYSSTNPNPSNSGANLTRTIEWQLDDGSGANNLSTPQHTTINLRNNLPDDFNGDGFSDILWQNDNGQPGIWTMNGLVRINGANVGFNPNGGPLQTGEIGPWKVKGAGDFNADAHADILWQNDNGTAGIWMMDGFNVIADSAIGFNPGPSWKIIDTGDFNADAHADILWQNDNGTAGIWLMDGFNRLAGANVGFNPGPSWHVKAAGDFNADGHSDILWQNDNGTAGIWLMDGFNVIGDGNVGFNPGPSWKVIDAGDFNGDAHADILWQNENGTPGIWTMDGLTRTGGANVGGFNPGPSWKVKTAGDYNGDGRSDILWQNDNGQPGIWLMDGFNVLQDGGVGFNPGSSWSVVGQSDLIGI